jgi:cbb3-type cytochrome oxidase subunit 3
MKQRLARVGLALFFAVILSTVCAALLGANLKIEYDIEMPIYVSYILACTSMSINILFWFSFAFQDKYKICMKYIVICIIMVYAISWLVPIASEILALATILYVSKKLKMIKKILIMASVWYAANMLFQLLTVFIRTYWIPLEKIETGILTNIILQIDLFIFFISIHLIGGEFNYDRWRLALVSFHLPTRGRVKAESQQSNRQGNISVRHYAGRLTAWAQSSPWKKRAFWIVTGSIIFQAAAVFVALFVSGISGSLLEGSLIMGTFFIVSKIIRDRYWHAPTVTLCSGMTIVLFGGLSRAVIEFKYSWLLCVLIGILVYYLFYWIETQAKISRDNASYREQMESMLNFKLEKGCDYDKMREIAIYKGLNNNEIFYLKCFYCDSMNGKTMYRKQLRSDEFIKKLGEPGIISERTIYNRLHSAEDKFNQLQQR